MADHGAQSSPTIDFGHAQCPAVPANTTDEDTNHLNAAPMLSHGDVLDQDLGQNSTYTSTSQKCACLVCLRISIFDRSNDDQFHCHFAACNFQRPPISNSSWDKRYDRNYRAHHVRSHYRQDQGRQKYQSPFCCPVEQCSFTSKRWSDLRRHTAAKHCDNPAKFTCSVIECKYNGEGNGFTRKDKLTAHYKAMHQGQRIHGQATQAIQPAPASSYYTGVSGSSSIGAMGK